MSCDVAINNPMIKYFDKTEEDLKKDVSMDVLELCDASTVVNISLQRKEKEKVDRKRKRQPENEELDNSTIENQEPSIHEELFQEDNDQPVDRVVKVVGWLERSLFESHDKTDNEEESEQFISGTWLDGNTPDPSLFKKNIRRTRVFLLEVEPNLNSEPLDLVCGYCYDGCKRFSAYSTVVWSQQDTYEVPWCPECYKTDIEKELRLMFKFKLRVMDPHGWHVDLNVWKEHAEELLGCSAEDFISKPSVREAAIMPLRQYTVANTIHEAFTPLLDVNLVCIKDIFFVVNSSLKQMNKCTTKRQEVTVLPPVPMPPTTRINRCNSDNVIEDDI